MSTSFRPWISVGVAAVVIGATTLAPVEPLSGRGEIRVENSAVELNAARSPFDYYPTVVLRSLENAGDRLSEYLSAPLPILSALTRTQYDALAEIVDAADRDDAGDVLGATLHALALPLINLVKVAGAGEPFRTAAGLLVRLALPAIRGAMAAGAATGDVADALFDVDVVGALSAVSNIPARIVDGLLNGRVDPGDDAEFGLLTPVVHAPVTDQVSGPVAFLVESLQHIGETISEPLVLPTVAVDVPALGAAAPAGHDLPPSEPRGSERPATTSVPADHDLPPDPIDTGPAESDDESPAGAATGHDSASDDGARAPRLASTADADDGPSDGSDPESGASDTGADS